MTGRASDVALVVALVALAAAIGAALPWDDTVNDLMFVETVDDVGVPVVIVRVDEATEEAHSDPLVYWDRLFAHVVDGAAAGGADRVVLDFLLYSLPGTMDPDWGFPLVSSMAIARSRGVEVINIAMALGDGSSNEVEVKGPHPMIQSASSGLALANVTEDGDGVVRRMELGCAEPYALARVLAGAGEDCATVHIRYRDVVGGWPGVSMQEVLEREEGGDVVWLREHFEGKTVLIGATAPKLGDLKRTPLSTFTPGVEIHAQAMRTLLEGDGPRPLPTAVGLLVVLLLGFGSMFAGQRLGPWPAIGLGVAAAILAGFGGIAAGMALDYRVPFVSWGLSILLPGVGAALKSVAWERAERQRMAQTLGSYVNKHVMAALEKDPEAAGIGGAMRTVTVLMADILGYSTFSENRAPQEVVAVLNNYFEAMTRVIQSHGGTVDKFMGDGLMAVFGAPLPLPHDGAPNAVAAARGMEAELERLRIGWRAEGIPELDIGIGIHTGEAIVGNMGSALKMEYTVIGDAVNVAARIESTTRKYGVRVLISGETMERIEETPDAADLGEVYVKGRAQPVQMWSLAPPPPPDH
ncbi:MAG: adenylate/guanylate cyclase domain-containing protein [Proteobacteria bacterium]|nr:adenylate/guanylate cyclase domain-containing protein [Pseudomonadota bacterium]